MSERKWGPDKPPKNPVEFRAAVREGRVARYRAMMRLQMYGASKVTTAPKLEDMTCNECRHEPYCDSAWDLYNTGGDCLESK